MNATIIVLNGVGSAGKGSIAKALQHIATDPFLHVQMDSFMEMMPEAYQNHPDGFAYDTVDDNGNPSVVITTGPVGERTLKGMRHAVAAMAAQGNNMIVDDVMLEDVGMEYAQLLIDHNVFFVGVHCPLDVLEAREQKRDDRMNGLARWQYEQVHSKMKYDLELDTSTTSAKDCAKQIKQRFRL